MSDATDKQLEEALPCNMRCSPGITHSVHCFAAHRPAVRALIDALIAGAYLAAADTMWRVICSKNSPPPHGTNAAKEAILLLTTDAARLAQRENGGFGPLYPNEKYKGPLHDLWTWAVGKEGYDKRKWEILQAELESSVQERDRRVTAEATRQTLMEIAANYGIAEKSNQMGAFKEGLGKRLEAAHRAAVQEKPHET